MRISRHQIIAFAAVGREKSFSRAAKTLGLGQSAITQHISALEAHLGAKLFIRRRAGAEFTSVGRELYSLADRIRVLEEQFFDRANQYAEASAGDLLVCVSTPKPAMAVISAFKEKYPRIKVELTVAPWREAVAKVKEREIDVAIAMRPDTLKGLHAIEIERRPFAAVLPRDHKLAARGEISVSEIAKETVIMLTDSSYTATWVKKKFDQLGISLINTLTTSSYEMMFEAVNHHLGVSIALEEAISHHMGIVTVPIQEFKEEHAFVALCSDDKVSLKTVSAFLEIVTLRRKGH